jgi:hypothetical protein
LRRLLPKHRWQFCSGSNPLFTGLPTIVGRHGSGLKSNFAIEPGSARQVSESDAGLSRFAIRTACEVLGGVAQASAEAFQVVNSHVSAEQPNVVEGILAKDILKF